MSEKLKECPFCGAERGLYVLHGGYDEGVLEVHVFCDTCKSGMMNEYACTEAEAIAAWNRRADLIEPEPERTCTFRWVGDEMQCSACGWLVTEHDADFEYYVTENTAKAFRYCPFCGAKAADE